MKRQEADYRRYVLTIDRARARFFGYVPAVEHPVPKRAQLVEVKDMIHPEGELKGKEIFDNMKSGRSTEAGTGAHGFDDHREAHEEKLTRDFVRAVVDRAVTMSGATTPGPPATFIVAAEPGLLGELRPLLSPMTKVGIDVVEVPKVLTKEKPNDLLERFQKDGLLT